MGGYTFAWICITADNKYTINMWESSITLSGSYLFSYFLGCPIISHFNVCGCCCSWSSYVEWACTTPAKPPQCEIYAIRWRSICEIKFSRRWFFLCFSSPPPLTMPMHRCVRPNSVQTRAACLVQTFFRVQPQGCCSPARPARRLCWPGLSCASNWICRNPFRAKVSLYFRNKRHR